jgi:hypothetical protein
MGLWGEYFNQRGKFMEQKILRTWMVAICAWMASSCNDKAADYLQKATFDLSDDFKSARIALVFTPKVKATFGSDFSIKDYGNLFTLPYVEGQQPFTAGFDLDMNVLYDNEYVEMAPTERLPNGLPLGLPHAVVGVEAGSIGGAHFHAYLDIKELSWLGMAVMIDAVDENFPEDLSVSQVFRRDAAGNPEVFGTFFGPMLDKQGNVIQSGGLALFANVKALIDARAEGRVNAAGAVELSPEAGFELSGPAAAYYRAHPAELGRISQKYMEALSNLR